MPGAGAGRIRWARWRASGDLYEQLVEAANGIYGSHPHRRALHAKGIWCEGGFTASPEAGQLCRATHFQGDLVPALIRFSNGSGDPECHDAGREARGMAVKLRPEVGGETDVLGTTNPAFATRTAEEFLELLRLRRPDPETGQPDWEKLGAFLAAHPESQPAIDATINSEPPASFAQLEYRSPHSFKLVNAAGEGTWVRYRWRPEAGRPRSPTTRPASAAATTSAKSSTSDCAAVPSGSSCCSRFPPRAIPSTMPPPSGRRTASWSSPAGSRSAEVVDDPESGDNIEVFDPVRIVDGIELSNDPILHARARAYSVSAYRRLGVEVENPSTPPTIPG